MNEIKETKKIVNEISSKLKQNKVHELSPDFQIYARILLLNNMITSNGQITDKGKIAIYGN